MGHTFTNHLYHTVFSTKGTSCAYIARLGLCRPLRGLYVIVSNAIHGLTPVATCCRPLRGLYAIVSNAILHPQQSGRPPDSRTKRPCEALTSDHSRHSLSL